MRHRYNLTKFARESHFAVGCESKETVLVRNEFTGKERVYRVLVMDAR